MNKTEKQKVIKALLKNIKTLKDHYSSLRIEEFCDKVLKIHYSTYYRIIKPDHLMKEDKRVMILLDGLSKRVNKLVGKK